MWPLAISDRWAELNARRKRLMRILLISFIISLIGCCQPRNNNLINIQNDYLNKKLKESLSGLQRTVENTGSPTMGVKFYEHARQLRVRLDSISNKLADSKSNDVKKLTKEFVEFANSAPDTVKLNSQFLLSSIEDYESENQVEYANNLMLFTIEAIDAYLGKYNSYFYMYDWVRPVIVPDRQNPKAGGPYNAEIFVGAANSGIRPIVKVDFLGDEHGYMEIPVNSYGVGQLEIGVLKKGVTEINVQIVEWNNNQERTVEKTLKINAE